MGLVPVEPPELLYHGTVERFLDSIREKGHLRGKRRHVHLSADRETTARVGQRRGRPVVLVVEAGRMHRERHSFFQSENRVWLTEAVPSTYLRFTREACNDVDGARILAVAVALVARRSRFVRTDFLAELRKRAKTEEFQWQLSVAEQLTPSDSLTGFGRGILYVRILQADGNLAWSSPIWIHPQGK